MNNVTFTSLMLSQEQTAETRIQCRDWITTSLRTQKLFAKQKFDDVRLHLLFTKEVNKAEIELHWEIKLR